MLHRYKDINYFLSLDFNEGLELIEFILEERLEEKVFQRWLFYQEMNYQDFKNQVIQKKIQIKDEKTILEEQKNIFEKFNMLGGKEVGNI